MPNKLVREFKCALTDIGGHCKRCGADSAVVDSRQNSKRAIRRRRECVDCKFRWTTYETDEHSMKIDDLNNRIRDMERAIVVMIGKFDEFKKHVSNVVEVDDRIAEFKSRIRGLKNGIKI